MTERTYGIDGYSLSDIRPANGFDTIPCDLAAHIRELQAEVTTLKAHAVPDGYQVVNIDQIKAERREFGMRVAEEVTLKCVAAVISGKQMVPADLAAIVEQELNK